MAISVSPLSDALGASIEGVDLSRPISDEQLATIEQAMTDHLLIVIRRQNLTPPQLLTALRLFGDTMRQHLSDMLMDGHPDIAVLDSRRSPVEQDGTVTPVGSRDWHTDHTIANARQSSPPFMPSTSPNPAVAIRVLPICIWPMMPCRPTSRLSTSA